MATTFTQELLRVFPSEGPFPLSLSPNSYKQAEELFYKFWLFHTSMLPMVILVVHMFSTLKNVCFLSLCLLVLAGKGFLPDTAENTFPAGLATGVIGGLLAAIFFLAGLYWSVAEMLFAWLWITGIHCIFRKQPV